MYEGGKKRIHMLEYITFSQGKSKTRTSADVYSPLVANWIWICDREGKKWFMQNFLNHLWRFCPTADQNSLHFLFHHETHFCVTELINVKCYLTPNKSSFWAEWMNWGHRILPWERKREILSFEYCTHYNGPEDLCAVKSYALVKLNKGKVFPHEGQMRISKWKYRQMSKSWGWFSAVWPWYLTQILRLQMNSLSSPSLFHRYLCPSLSVCAWGKPQGLSAASSLKALFHFQDRAGLQYGHCLYTNVALGIMFISITVLKEEEGRKKQKECQACLHTLLFMK